MLQSTLVLKNLPKLWQKYKPVSRFLYNLTSITCCSQLQCQKIYQIYGKCNIFLMAVYMIFKYSKRFRYAPSFNYNSFRGKGWKLRFKVPQAIMLEICNALGIPMFRLIFCVLIIQGSRLVYAYAGYLNMNFFGWYYDGNIYDTIS